MTVVHIYCSRLDNIFDCNNLHTSIEYIYISTKLSSVHDFLLLFWVCIYTAVEASRQQLEQFQITQGAKPVFEEFIPLKHPSSDEATPNMQSDKANWMTSAQLWSQANQAGTMHQADNTSLKDLEPSLGISPKLAIENKHRNGGAFLPFTKAERSSTSPGFPELALAPTDKDQMEEMKCNMDADKGINACQRRENSSKLGNGGAGAIVEQGKLGAAMSAETQGITPTSTTQTHRKARRCWSPDLHKRFVNALQMLGGSQGI